MMLLNLFLMNWMLAWPLNSGVDCCVFLILRWYLGRWHWAQPSWSWRIRSWRLGLRWFSWMNRLPWIPSPQLIVVILCFFGLWEPYEMIVRVQLIHYNIVWRSFKAISQIKMLTFFQCPPSNLIDSQRWPNVPRLSVEFAGIVLKLIPKLKFRFSKTSHGI